MASVHPSDVPRVAAHLARQDYVFYNPRFVETIVRRGRKVERVRSLFPGYLLVKIVDVWHALLGTRGILGLVMSGEKPAVCPQHEIDTLRAQERADGLIVLAPPAPRFAPGDRVRVVGRGVMDTEAIFEKDRPNDRVRVLLKTLGRYVPTDLHVGDLAAI